MKLGIIGAGGHGQVVAEAVLHSSPPQLIGFFDDDPQWHGQVLRGVPVCAIASMSRDLCDTVVVAIGDNRRRSELFARLSAQAFEAYVVLHPRATLASDVSVGAGTMALAGAVVNTGSRIGRNVILNTACSLDHHNDIGDHAHVAPGVHTGGNVTIGEGAFIGLGALLLPGISIGPWAIVGAGAVVLRDVPAGATVVGNPAKQIHS